MSKTINIHPEFRKHAAFIQGYMEKMFGFPVRTNEALMYAIHVTFRAQPKRLPDIPTNPHLRGTKSYTPWTASITDEAFRKLNYLAGIFQYEPAQMASACLIGTATSIRQVDILSRTKTKAEPIPDPRR